MLKSKGPQLQVSLIRPHDCGMQKHSTCPCRHSLDCTFTNAILVMSTDAREVDSLATVFDMLTECLRAEQGIVSTIALDLVPTGCCHLFKAFLGLQSFAGSQRDLML